MKNDPTSHHRRSIRLKSFDYRRAGTYFASICAQDRACLFGEVMDGEMQVNNVGQMVIAKWHALPERFPAVELDAFIVMPNHIHGVIVIATNDVGAGLVPAQSRAIATNGVGAGLVPARSHAIATNGVGAGLVPAQSRVIATNDVGAGLVPAQSRAIATNGVGAGLVPARSHANADRRSTTIRATTRVAPTLGQVVGAFKSWTTVLYAHGVNIYGWPPFNRRLWQRNYYEHIVRDEESLWRIRQYIADNPARWTFDRDNPLAVAPEKEKAWQA